MKKPKNPGRPPLSRRRAGAESREEAPPSRQKHAPASPLVEAPPPFSRRVDVRSMPGPGLEETIEADAAERAALATFLGALSVESLTGRYELRAGSGGKVLVEGRARARLTRACVVTLEPVAETVDEPVEVVFSPDPGRQPAHGALTSGRGGRAEEVDLIALSEVDPPEPIVEGHIDLGALTVEFVALALDPYPRKEGAVFEAPPEAGEGGAFADLAALKPRETGE